MVAEPYTMESALDANLAFRNTDPPHRSNPPQSEFSFNRRERPPPMDWSNGRDQADRVPLAQKKLDRRVSKGGLRAIFTRSKGQLEKNIVSPIEESTPLSATTVSSRNGAPLTSSITKSTTATSPPSPATPATPITPATRQSRMTLRARSTKQNKPASKPSPNSAKFSPRASTRTSAAWYPPPLFQAYPQAIKHATLATSTLSADAIIRMSNRKRSNSIRDDIAQPSEQGGPEQTAAAKKAEKAKMKHRRQLSGSISKADWTQKIFVLVTSGYLLQYAGDGTFDRLPEKMMLLGKDSVAFASDAIPGKHWVLQISQAMDPDGAPTADSRSLLSRLAFRGGDYRRTATSLLLVMNDAEEMDSWLAVVRREIEALGGKKHVSETGNPNPDEKVMQLKAQLSHRYLAPRGPEQFSNPSPPASPTTVAPWSENPLRLRTADLPTFSDPHSRHNSNGPNSVANSLDGRHLDNLTDSTNRLSFMSSGQRTLITSQGSSPSNSTRESCSTLDDYAPKMSVEDSRMRPNASTVNERRRSMQTMPTRPIRAPSPAATNFSVPSSSSKRLSSIKSMPRKSFGADTLSVPHIVTTTYDSANVQANLAKALPEVPSARRLISPMSDSKHIEREPIYQGNPNLYSSYKGLAPIGEPSASLPGYHSESHSEHQPERRSSLMPTNCPEKQAFANFQFPRRYSAMPPSLDRNLNTSSKPVLPAFSLPETPMDSPITPNRSTRSSSYPNSLPSEQNMPIPELPVLPTTNNSKKLRRPISMQMRSLKEPKPSHALSPPPLPADLSTHTPGSANAIPQLQPGPSSPLIPRGKPEETEKALAPRKSLPVLVNGPPAAPPPRCALPPLPRPGKSPPSVGWRNSLRV